MRHTHYGYAADESAKTLTHDHDCEAPEDHFHGDEFLVIYHDETG